MGAYHPTTSVQSGICNAQELFYRFEKGKKGEAVQFPLAFFCDTTEM